MKSRVYANCVNGSMLADVGLRFEGADMQMIRCVAWYLCLVCQKVI